MSSRPKTLSEFSNYSLGLLLPFGALGLSAGSTVIPLSLLASLGLLLSIVARPRLPRVALPAAVMLCFYFFSAAFEYPLGSVIPSLALFLLAITPFVVSSATDPGLLFATRGFLLSLKLSIILVFVQYLAHTQDIQPVNDLFNLMFPYGNTNSFLGVPRPTTSFLEPSYLAIYLAVSFFALVAFSNERQGLWLALIVLAIFLIGSASGAILLAIGAILGGLQWITSHRRDQSLRVPKSAVILALVLLPLGIAAFGDNVLALLSRLSVAVEALESGELNGSEASRINAFRAVTMLWREEGLKEVMLGIGYANTEEWLSSQFANAGMFASYARGHIDNVFVTVCVSVGLVGFVIFFWFSASALSLGGAVKLQRSVLILLMFSAVGFFHGYLVYYLFWHLFFVVTCFAKLKAVEPAATVTSGKIGAIPIQKLQPDRV